MPKFLIFKKKKKLEKNWRKWDEISVTLNQTQKKNKLAIPEI